jgi:hypothetical protein
VAKVVTITPADAQQLLVNNTGNRPIRKDHVANLARDMVQGNWVMDGSAIRFDTTGRLLDGQHRLTACIKASKPFSTLLVTGIVPEAGVIMDTGAKRTAGDMLNMIGGYRGLGNNAASVVRILIGYAIGDVAGAKMTSAEVYQVIQKHPGIIQSIAAMGKSPIERSLVASLHYVMVSDGHDGAAEAWRTTWGEGIPAYKGDPSHILRERFLRERGGKIKSTVPARRSLALNAYRHFIAQTPVSLLKETTDTRLKGWSLPRLGLPERLTEKSK